MNLVGKIIGNRYEILEEVGNGGMALVYKAKDHVLNRFVAVKILKDEFTTDSDFIKRFNSEAQSAAALSHANIVSIYDVGHEEENNLYYIVMELIKGKTLKEIIDKDGILSWKWSINIAIQIASALELAHKNGIIHRDIKPHNIIITEDGVAKVTDFGIAKAVSNSTITAFGTTIGSVHYFSPEQAKGSLTDAKSDIYSLGVVMYEMLTGEVPFDADTPVSVALKHMQEEPTEAIKINKNIPTAINDIVMKAMQKDPESRYQSATEMLADLSKALKDPDGDFVIIENKDGGYTRIMNAVSEDDIKNNKKKKGKKKNFFAEHKKTAIAVGILSLVLLFVIVFLITRLVLDTKKVVIPNLVGKTEAEARQLAQESKVIIEIGESQASSEVEEGKIISQEPPFSEGEKIAEGTKIKIILSTGPETTKLPDFENKSIEDVRRDASRMGLVLEEVFENHNEIEEGKVISQDTNPGVLVKSGDKIVVHVSKGVKKTTVPTVIDMDEGTAKATLSNAKLKANVTYTNDPTKQDGKVISQSIEQGEEVAEDTTIDLTVNKIEVVKKNVNLKLLVTVSDSVLNSIKNNSKNETTESTNANTSVKLKVTVNVNGNQKEVNATVDLSKMIKEDEKTQTIDLDKITGTGSQNVELQVLNTSTNETTKIGPETFDIDAFKDDATHYVRYTLNKI